MTGAEILFLIFVILPAAGGYCWLMWASVIFSWKIKEYLKVRKEYMQKVIDGEDPLSKVD